MSLTHWLSYEIANQRKWIQEHGGDLTGYIRRYGTAEHPLHGTMGGPAVFAADVAVLHNLERQAGYKTLTRFDDFDYMDVPARITFAPSKGYIEVTDRDELAALIEALVIKLHWGSKGNRRREYELFTPFQTRESVEYFLLGRRHALLQDLGPSVSSQPTTRGARQSWMLTAAAEADFIAESKSELQRQIDVAFVDQQRRIDDR